MSHYTGGVKNRRTRVIARLEKQLKDGRKWISKEAGFRPLTDKDIARIEKERETLKSRA